MYCVKAHVHAVEWTKTSVHRDCDATASMCFVVKEINQRILLIYFFRIKSLAKLMDGCVDGVVCDEDDACLIPPYESQAQTTQGYTKAIGFALFLFFLCVKMRILFLFTRSAFVSHEQYNASDWELAFAIFFIFKYAILCLRK